MLTDAACQTTVFILEAVILGTNGDCIDLGPGSILSAVAGFMVAVVVLKILGKAILVRMASGLSSKPAAAADPVEAPDVPGRIGKTDYDGGPIRSARPR